jgi:hypothetical protein
MEPGRSLPYSQQPFTGPYPEPDESSPYNPILVRIILRLAVYRQSVRLSDNPLRLTTSHFIFQLNTCGYSPYVTSSERMRL